MKTIIKWWLKFEYSTYMVDAYLAQMRGNWGEMAEFNCKAYDAQRKLQIIRLNSIYGSTR